jgi:hypothetical protein
MALLELPSPQEVDRVVVRDAEQPGEQAPSIGLERAWMTPQLQEGFLDDLFGRRAVAQQPQRERVHATTVTLIRQLQGGRLTTSHRCDQAGLVVQCPRQGRADRRGVAVSTQGSSDVHGEASIAAPDERVNGHYSSYAERAAERFKTVTFTNRNLPVTSSGQNATRL